MSGHLLSDTDQEYIKSLWPVCDFKGVKFRDISPLLYDPKAMRLVCDAIATYCRGKQIDAVAGLEARGFLFGPIIALALGVGFVALRKPGKLPGNVLKVTYMKEYGPDTIELQEGLLKKGARVLIVDDLLATGGTLIAACQLVHQAGAVPAICALVCDLGFLGGKKTIIEQCECKDVVSLVTF